jgi:hypothetical protein
MISPWSVCLVRRKTMSGRDYSGNFYLLDFWRKRGEQWQIIARYSSPVGQPPERPKLQLPSPADVDSQLTDVLRQFEQELAKAALDGFKDPRAMDRLVSPEFTVRFSDAPERSMPRALWSQPSSTYKIESLEERYDAAR